MQTIHVRIEELSAGHVIVGVEIDGTPTARELQYREAISHVLQFVIPKIAEKMEAESVEKFPGRVPGGN